MMKDIRGYMETEKKMEKSIDRLFHRRKKVSDDIPLIFDGHIIFSTLFIDEIMMSITANNNLPRS